MRTTFTSSTIAWGNSRLELPRSAAPTPHTRSPLGSLSLSVIGSSLLLRGAALRVPLVERSCRSEHLGLLDLSRPAAGADQEKARSDPEPDTVVLEGRRSL